MFNFNLVTNFSKKIIHFCTTKHTRNFLHIHTHTYTSSFHNHNYQLYTTHIIYIHFQNISEHKQIINVFTSSYTTIYPIYISAHICVHLILYLDYKYTTYYKSFIPIQSYIEFTHTCFYLLRPDLLLKAQPYPSCNPMSSTFILNG